MKHTQEEILNALQVIKDTCNELGTKKEGCYNCPLYLNAECVLSCRCPTEWELNTGGPVWRAFK